MEKIQIQDASIRLNVVTPVVLKGALLLLGVGVVYILGYCIYQLLFHPLAKYPGPFLAKVSNGYAAYHAWKGDLHIDMWRCHVKYGDFVRYAPNRLNVNTSTGLRDIYTHGKNFRKSKNYNAMVHRALNTLTITDKKEHGRRRRVMSQGFSDASMRSYEPSMLAQAQKFCACLARSDEQLSAKTVERWLPARNMSQWCNYLAFDTMSDLIFGSDYDLLGKPDNRFVVDAIEASNVRVSVLLQAPEAITGRLDKWLFPESIQGRDRFIKFVNRLLRDTMKVDRSKRRDIFSILSTAKDPETGSGLGRAEIIAESTTLIVAGMASPASCAAELEDGLANDFVTGTDTSSTAMTGMFFYLAHYPHAYARAAQEVRSTFGDCSEIRIGPKLNSCSYLRACIDECMRMSPSVGSSLFREVQAGGAMVDGEFIPAGVDVGTPIYSIHHNPAYFPDPFAFLPERWLVSEASNTAGFGAYNPFSVGPRSCIGKGMALTELMLTMATVLLTLDFKLADGDEAGGMLSAEWGRHRPDEFQLRDHVTAAKNGPMIHFRIRDVESD
ncbi:MAG: hypothetical protein M1837_006350 [Sclerophora amabilis]|nr:MAG: hypothetical protein M1837_006350 [Sclerophora amabilis]